MAVGRSAEGTVWGGAVEGTGWTGVGGRDGAAGAAEGAATDALEIKGKLDYIKMKMIDTNIYILISFFILL